MQKVWFGRVWCMAGRWQLLSLEEGLRRPRIVERAWPVVPSARTCPDIAFGAMVVIASNIIWTWPAITSLRAPELVL